MISCNYNGWADVPEEEREAMDAFEASRSVRPVIPAIRPPLTILYLPKRKAA